MADAAPFGASFVCKDMETLDRTRKFRMDTLTEDSAQDPQPSTRLRGGFMARALLAEETLLYSPATLKYAALQMVLGPVLVAGLMLLAGAPPVLAMLMLEAELVAMLAAAELWRAREFSRKFAIVLGGLNFVFVLAFGTITGNLFMLLAQGVSSAALALMIYGRCERKNARRTSWAVLILGIGILAGALLWGHASVTQAKEAYRAGDYAAADAMFNAAWPVIALRGGSDTERSLFAFRRAELAYRMGRAQEAWEDFERCEEMALKPNGASKLGADPNGIPSHDMRRTLAWTLTNQSLLELRPKYYALLVFGTRAELPADPLASVEFSAADRVTWGW